MAASVSSINVNHVVGSLRRVNATIAFSGTSTTGGEAVSLAALGFRNGLTDVSAGQATDGAGNVYLVRWNGNTTSPALQLVRQTAAQGPLADLPSGVSLTGFTASVTFHGK